MLDLTRQFGVVPDSAFAFAVYSEAILGTAHPDEHYLLGVVADHLLTSFGDAGTVAMSRTLMLVWAVIYEWRKVSSLKWGVSASYHMLLTLLPRFPACAHHLSVASLHSQ